MFLTFSGKIWFYPKPVDFRKQLNGLVVLIADTLEKDPGSGELFIFRNKAGNKLKSVYFDGYCFWMLYCRFEKGRFQLPLPDDKVFSLQYGQLQQLLSGIDFINRKQKKTSAFKHYY